MNEKEKRGGKIIYHTRIFWQVVKFLVMRAIAIPQQIFRLRR